jgi:hypothetical protein
MLENLGGRRNRRHAHEMEKATISNRNEKQHKRSSMTLLDD